MQEEDELHGTQAKMKTHGEGENERGEMKEAEDEGQEA